MLRKPCSFDLIWLDNDVRNEIPPIQSEILPVKFFFYKTGFFFAKSLLCERVSTYLKQKLIWQK